MSSNPYQAPQAPVVDFQPLRTDGACLDAPRRMPAGRGVAWLSEAWAMFREAPGLWIGMFVVLMAVVMATSLVPLAGILLPAMAMPVMLAGMMVACDAQQRGEPVQFGQLFAGFSTNTGQLLLAGVLYAVALLAVMLITVVPIVGTFGLAVMASGDAEALADGGAQFALLMLLAMLVYMAFALPLMMAMWFAPALIVLDGKPALAAMRMSFMGCLKNIVPFLIYGLVGLLLAIVASIPLMLGWLVLGPVISLSSYTAYRDIFFAEG
jgi:uncharacterized membrane protein